MIIEMEPIGAVRAVRTEVTDDFWGGSESQIVLDERFGPDAFDGIEEFSHVEIIFWFDRVHPEQVNPGKRRPRGDPRWPEVGIFAQRGRGRPNRIGCTICRLVHREGRIITVAELDAIDGTPVLDIKPVIRGFLPREEVRQPEWATELMKDYWAAGDLST